MGTWEWNGDVQMGGERRGKQGKKVGKWEKSESGEEGKERNNMG